MFCSATQSLLEGTDFEQIAIHLMNKCAISVYTGENTLPKLYRIIEIEFYLCNEKHGDQYTHCHNDQLTTRMWYFHKAGNSDTYRGGSFKGVDITFGVTGYGGILIRSIERIDDQFVIEGPCKSVNEFLANIGVNNIQDFIKGSSHSIFSATYMQLMPYAHEEVLQPYKSVRVGLKPKYPDFIDQPYRFVIKPWLIHKKRTNIMHGLYQYHYHDKEEMLKVVKLMKVRKTPAKKSLKLPEPFIKRKPMSSDNDHHTNE